jgi:hypothetical protein
LFTRCGDALISSAMTAKRIQSNMKLGTAILDVDLAVPPRGDMKFVSLKAAEMKPFATRTN